MRSYSWPPSCGPKAHRTSAALLLLLLSLCVAIRSIGEATLLLLLCRLWWHISSDRQHSSLCSFSRSSSTDQAHHQRVYVPAASLCTVPLVGLHKTTAVPAAAVDSFTAAALSLKRPHYLVVNDPHSLTLDFGALLITAGGPISLVHANASSGCCFPCGS